MTAALTCILSCADSFSVHDDAGRHGRVAASSPRLPALLHPTDSPAELGLGARAPSNPIYSGRDRDPLPARLRQNLQLQYLRARPARDTRWRRTELAGAKPRWRPSLEVRARAHNGFGSVPVLLLQRSILTDEQGLFVCIAYMTLLHFSTRARWYTQSSQNPNAGASMEPASLCSA